MKKNKINFKYIFGFFLSIILATIIFSITNPGDKFFRNILYGLNPSFSLSVVFIFVIIIFSLLLWISRLNKSIALTQRELKKLSYYDDLTELPNRGQFIDRLNIEIKKNNKGAVAILDIDNFQSLNNILGYEFGNRVLREIALILKETLDKDCFISRFGGDEFLIFFPISNQVESVTNQSIKLLERFKNPILIDGKKITLSFSMGISIFPEDGNNHDEIIKKADIAMYKIKNRGKNSFDFFQDFMLKDIERKIYVKDVLKKALKENSFYLLYQPQVSCSSQEVIGFEALVRLKDKDIYPGEFIPIAEETDLIIDIGRLVIKNVVSQLAIWKEKGLALKPVSINFSQIQIKDYSLHTYLDELLYKYNIDPKYIEIEITENLLFHNEVEVIDFLNKFKDLDIKIALDDFGKGFSSLNYLTFLPVDKIKLDKSLNDQFLSNGTRDIKVIESIIKLGHSLNLEVLAEGVETKEDFLILKSIGCNTVQGYLFGRPIESAQLEVIWDEKFTVK